MFFWILMFFCPNGFLRNKTIKQRYEKLTTKQKSSTLICDNHIIPHTFYQLLKTSTKVCKSVNLRLFLNR